MRLSRRSRGFPKTIRWRRDARGSWASVDVAGLGAATGVEAAPVGLSGSGSDPRLVGGMVRSTPAQPGKSRGEQGGAIDRRGRAGLPVASRLPIMVLSRLGPGGARTSYNYEIP